MADKYGIMYHLLAKGVIPKLEFPNLALFIGLHNMSVLENNTTHATSLLSNLLNAVAIHDTVLVDANTAYNSKTRALEALRAAGFKSMQAGSALRYNANAAPLKGEYSYIAAVTEFESRFNAAWDSKLSPDQLLDRKNDDTKHRPSKKKVDDNNKQRVSTLNLWLKTGKFSNNTGKDKPRLEHEFSLERVDLNAVSVEITAKAATLAARQVKETAAAILKNTAALKKIDPTAGDMSANAFKIATDKAAALKVELKEANASNTKAVKAAACAKAKLDEANLVAKNTKDKLDLKNQSLIDIRAMAKKIGGQLTSDQIKQLIDLLQAEII